MKKTALSGLSIGFAIGLVALLISTRVTAAPGDLFVSTYGRSSIVKFTPDGTQSTFAFPISGPFGVAFDSARNLYVSERNSDPPHIIKVTPDGTRSIVASGQDGQYFGDIAVDRADNIFVADGASIFKFDRNGTKSLFADGFVWTYGIATDRWGNLFVTDNAGEYECSILKIAPDGTKSTFVSGVRDLRGGLAFDSAGNLYSADAYGHILKFTPDAQQSTFATLQFQTPFGLDFDSADNLYSADITIGTIFEFTPGGTKSVFAFGLRYPNYIAFEPPV